MNAPLRHLHVDTTPLAFSYLRLSSKRQLEGQGFERQIERARIYAEAHGMELDESNDMRDLGVSAFTGANRHNGALGRFLRLVEAGRIPVNSVLICESLDRLSRSHILDALQMFTAVINAGIKLVTLGDGMEYTKDKINENFAQLIISIAVMSRAHEESKTKSDRLQQAWIKKRKMAKDKKLSAKGPSWLQLSEDRTKWEFVPGRKAMLNRAFEELANGVGRGSVARRLNADGIRQPNGKPWTSGTISALSKSINVIGWYQPCKLEFHVVDGVRQQRRVPAGDIIKDYYPAAISMELWERAQASMKSRALGQPMNAAGRKGSKVSNLFGNMAQCGVCGGSMKFRDRGPRSTVVLRCSSNEAGVCDNEARIPYADLETKVLRWVDEVDFDVAPTPETDAVAEELAGKRVEREQLKKSIDALIDLAEKGRDVNDRLQQRETELAGLEAEIAALEARVAKVSRQVTPRDRQDLIAQLAKEMVDGDVYYTRRRLQQTLRELFDEMICTPMGTVTLTILNNLITYHFMQDGRVIKQDERPRMQSGANGHLKHELEPATPARKKLKDKLMKHSL